MLVEDDVQAIFDDLEGRTFGSTTVVDARVLETADEEGEPAISLELVLSDPESDTWPWTDVRALRREVTKLAFDLTAPVFVRMLPTSDAPQADDDAFSL